MNVNSVIVVGRIGQDVQIKNTPSGQCVANLSVATTRKWTSQQGQPSEKTEWHRIVVWGKQAENCGKYLQKGQEVAIEGRMETRDWLDTQQVKHWTTEIVANSVQFGAKPLGQQAQQPQQQFNQQAQQPVQGAQGVPQQGFAPQAQQPAPGQYQQQPPAPHQGYAQQPPAPGPQGNANQRPAPAGNAAPPPQQNSRPPQQSQPGTAAPQPGGEQPQFVGNQKDGEIPF